MNEFFEILLNAIVKIEDLSGQEITYKTLTVENVKSPKSKIATNLLFIDNEPCNGIKRKYIIYYKCRCNKIQKCLLQKYLQKQKLCCHYCSQKKEFGEMGHNNPKYQRKYNRKKIYNFDDESQQFKDEYDKLHLSNSEFKLWIPKILKINDLAITDDYRKNIIYEHHVQCNNQSRYTSKIYINDISETVYNVSLQCDCCKKVFNAHAFNLKNKDINNIKCRSCALVNTRFPIRNYKDTNLTYQSSIEKYFLDRCFERNIKVNNGLNIPYVWKNKKRTYISDFYLPDYGYIIELKSNNIYYRMQVDNGKLAAKNEAANKFAKDNNLRFIFLFDNEITTFIEHLNE